MIVDKCVKDAGDTNRLSKKLEKKMVTLVEKATPEDMKDSMQGQLVFELIYIQISPFNTRNSTKCEKCQLFNRVRS